MVEGLRERRYPLSVIRVFGDHDFGYEWSIRSTM